MVRVFLFAISLPFLLVKPVCAQGSDADNQIRVLSNYHAIMFGSQVCAFEIRVEGVRAIKTFTAELAGIRENEIAEKISEYRIDDSVRSDYKNDVVEFCNRAFKIFRHPLVLRTGADFVDLGSNRAIFKEVASLRQPILVAEMELDLVPAAERTGLSEFASSPQ